MEGDLKNIEHFPRWKSLFSNLINTTGPFLSVIFNKKRLQS